MKKKIIAFAGSNSSASINKQLVKFVLSYFDGYELTLLDLNDFEMPLFSVDREKQSGHPNQAYNFLEAMKTADAIVCSVAEHNKNFTVAMKNVIDWCSRVELNFFYDKPMLLMSTSTGGFGGGNSMNAAKFLFPKCGANIIETFSLPSFGKNFGEQRILDEALKKELEIKIDTFKKQLQES